jgi:hypothetical protein
MNNSTRRFLLVAGLSCTKPLQAHCRDKRCLKQKTSHYGENHMVSHETAIVFGFGGNK